MLPGVQGEEFRWTKWMKGNVIWLVELVISSTIITTTIIIIIIIVIVIVIIIIIIIIITAMSFFFQLSFQVCWRHHSYL